MLAGRGAQGKQPLLRLFQQAGIDVGVGVGNKARQDGFRLGQRFLGAFQRGHRGFGRIAAGHGFPRWRKPLQRPGRRAQRCGGTGGAAVPRCQFRKRGSDRLRSPFVLLQAMALARKRIFLADTRRERGKFLHRVAQPFLIALGRRDGLPGRVQPGDSVTPGSPCSGDRGSKRPRNPKRVKQRSVAGGIGQTHLLMLALHFDQQRANTAQQPSPNRLVIHKRSGPPILRHDPPQHDLILRGQPLLLQQRGQRRVARGSKARGDASLFGRRAHQPAIGAGAKRKAKTVQQNRLASPGFAGQHGQALAERQIQPLDQNDIANRQRGQHAGLPTGRGSEHRMPCTREEARLLGIVGLRLAVAPRHAVIDKLRVAVGVPLAARIIVAKDGGRLSSLILQAQGKINLGQPSQRFRHMVGGLEIVDHPLVAADSRLIKVLLLIKAADFHFLAGQMVNAQVDLQLRIIRVTGVGEPRHNLSQRIHRLLGPALVTLDIRDLLIITQSAQIIGVADIAMRRMQLYEPVERADRLGVLVLQIKRVARHKLGIHRPA